MVQQGTREEGFEVTTKKTTQVRDSVLAKLCKYNVDHNIIKKNNINLRQTSEQYQTINGINKKIFI